MLLEKYNCILTPPQAVYKDHSNISFPNKLPEVCRSEQKRLSDVQKNMHVVISKNLKVKLNLPKQALMQSTGSIIFGLVLALEKT